MRQPIEFPPETPFVNPASLPANATPTPDQPGTYRQQLLIIDLYLADPTRRSDPRGAWQMARRLVLDHARRGER